MSSQPEFLTRYDAIVVGARCAGAATAMLLARSGLRVLVIDRARYGTDTLSTHALMRGAVLRLHQWGVLPAIIEAGAAPVTNTVFYYAGEPLVVPIKPRAGVSALYAPARALLDRVLADAASRAGAHVVHETAMRELLRAADGRVRGIVLQDRRGRNHRIAAEIVVGADGLHSTVARLAGSSIYRSGHYMSSVVYAHWSGVHLDGYRWYYLPDLSAGAIPTMRDEACVFVSIPSNRFLETFRGDMSSAYMKLLRAIAPELAEAMGRGRQTGGFRGFAGHPGHFRQSWGPGWALVGDAGYFKDPLTAHGITDALRDAELLASAIVSGNEEDLETYQHARDELSGELFDITDRIASFKWTLDEVQVLHHRLAKEMSKDVTGLVNDVPPAAPAVREPSSARIRGAVA